ncbi:MULTISPECIES: NAD(P)-dependent alcohol dehydrogenase [unclassified Actinomyces]|uniref:NAD(P)-dependent alcohol dehydrogenase n=1 Tax=unclassified Actinomyces TaxID=2609248 RepID=UPI002017F188|nr:MULTISPECIES: NAD(P)-dependent alcohol dehydrogenase [unclassified Actinomyces]MCL3777168.1 NAD(P)-dependent alcohol dehydrogenase [Actinomyces sp. AC-20-1]MCL3789008.1 NAD(P)-dependent alcohol dehydrogenase [Actinomyces sp. 187325]MCL3791363.1 NAD(P)-dependent alcohol dehydrogenase [Actinomyces sp. 186855]MCL3793926.1 NAD(P)-dependent alcohol dehydrogenase [Actinomyces sp. 217892]
MTTTEQLPTTMRAQVLLRAGTVAVQQRPVPDPDPDQVLVRIESVGVCGSDVHYYQHGRIGDFVVEEPMVLGHEAAGTIVAVGSDVDPSRVGRRVSIEPQRCCRVCEFCKRGEYNLCPRIEFYATPPIDGCFSEYALIQDDFAHEIPDSMSFDAGALLEPLSVAIASARKAALTVGSTVLVAGAGPIGVIVAQVARAYGATEVVVTDPVEARRRTALELGATEACAPGAAALDGRVFDAFFDATGVTAAVVDGIKRVKAGGTAVIIGMGDDDMLLPVSYITSHEVGVTGVFRYHNTWPTAIELVASGKVDLDRLATDHYALDDAETPLSTRPGPTTLKAMVHPGR